MFLIYLDCAEVLLYSAVFWCSIIYCGVISLSKTMHAVCLGVRGSCCQFSESKQHRGNTVAKRSLGDAAQSTTAMTAYHQRCHETKANKPIKQNKDNTLTHTLKDQCVTFRGI